MFALFGFITDTISSTNIPQQIMNNDLSLFLNPWFLIFFLPYVGWAIYKQSWKELLVVAVAFGLWWVSGTEYMKTLVVKDELDKTKILPVLGGGAALIALLIYTFFVGGD